MLNGFKEENERFVFFYNTCLQNFDFMYITNKYLSNNVNRQHNLAIYFIDYNCSFNINTIK